MHDIRHVVLPIVAHHTAQTVPVLPTWQPIVHLAQVQSLHSNTASVGAFLKVSSKVLSEWH